MSAASPCNRVCRLDPASGVCIGCFRTGDEIGAWSAMTDAERARLNDALPARRQALEATWFPEEESGPARRP